MALRLRPLAVADETEALTAQIEMAPEGFSFLLGWTPATAWTDYLDTLERHRRGLDLAGDRVAATLLVAEVDGELVGRVSIRHGLNDRLEAVGGHIGYGVRPRHRRLGHATDIIRQALVVAWSVGVEPILVTCADDNVASIATIERVGGVLEDVGPDAGARRTRRYWIR